MGNNNFTKIGPQDGSFGGKLSGIKDAVLSNAPTDSNFTKNQIFLPREWNISTISELKLSNIVSTLNATRRKF